VVRVTHPACAICKGACCESLAVPFPPDDDTAAFLALRGTVDPAPRRVPSGEDVVYVYLEVRCSQLTRSGRCGCYDTRPGVCRAYEVGGVGCRAAVRRRRSAALAARIEPLFTEVD